MKAYIYQLAVEVILYMSENLFPTSAKGNCLTGAFYFTHGKSMVDNHVLGGHVIANFTAQELIDCFRACRLECRCISFNYEQTQNKCQLNEESRYTNASALGFAEGWQYYDLVIDYNIQAIVPMVQCENGCCESNPCLNGGTCHETCDVIGKRITCECGPFAHGTFCEYANCSRPDWLYFNNSCFKVSTEAVNWFDAQHSCAQNNSNLASIHGAGENNFVRSIVPGSGSVWIGFSSVYSTDSRYEWIDGSKVSFTNWHLGEPTHRYYGVEENCTQMYSDGTWNDLNCTSYSLSYVCGKKLNP